MANPIWLAMMIILGACHFPAARQSAAVAAVPACTVAGELVRSGDGLAYELDGVTRWRRAGPTAQPYRVVALGPPALVTVVDADLTLTTWAAAAQPLAYSGLFPQVIRPPVMALGGLADTTEALDFHTVLLDPAGRPRWSADDALLLWPQLDGDPSAVVYCARIAPGNPEYELLMPFGDAPRLVAVDAVTGAELWETDLAVRGLVADLQLAALSPTHGLLILQYDYYLYELLVFDRPTGAVTARHELVGMPATRVAYPGAFDEWSDLTAEGEVIALGVFLERGPAEIWRIDLPGGGVVREPFTPVGGAREDNPAAVGGRGVPGPGQPVFDQRLLPLVEGAEWRIPALTDGAGRVLVIDAGGARWIGDEGRNDPAGGQ